MNIKASLLIFVFVDFLPNALASCRSYYQCSYSTYSKSRHTKGCGWFNWSRCAYYRQSSRRHYKWCYRYKPCPPVNGNWGGWNSWSQYSGCNRSCGYGTKTLVRKRYCNNPYPRYGGRNCRGSSRTYKTVRCFQKYCPIHGGYTSWGSWNFCNKNCGGGTKYRYRYCTNPRPRYGGRKCTGSSYQYTSCNNQKCPVHGNWGGWYSWSQYSGCNRSCGYGTKTLVRKRYCNNPYPRYGGRNCRGSSRTYKAVQCFKKYCPVHGGYTNWGAWNSCNKNCGGGTKYRYRYCTSPKPRYGGKKCKGSSYQYTSCNSQRCPVHGGYSSWGAWSSCSKSCGSGNKTRYRSCTNPRPQYGGKTCKGLSYQNTYCNKKNCPVDGGYTTWGEWSACNKSCGGGTKSRNRHCTNPKPKYGGKNCVGATHQHNPCNTHNCPVHGKWGNWRQWKKTGRCSKQCGFGKQSYYKTRACIPPKFGGKQCSGKTVEYKTKPCLIRYCPVNGNWTTFGSFTKWTPCNVTCGGGITSRQQSRSCTNPTPAYGGKSCSGDSIRIERKNCNLNPCPVPGVLLTWGSWKLSGSCSKSCGNGSQIYQRQRTCIPPKYGGKSCTGSTQQTKTISCFLGHCPVDGNWTQFGQFTEWTPCNVTCGGGTMFRKQVRSCTNPKPAHGGKECSGSGINTESKSCSSHPCPVNGNWTNFGSFTKWTPCNVTCGGGITSRQQSRSCTNPTPAHGGKSCSGNSIRIERKNCNLNPCPVDGNWTQFGQFTEWTPCNVTCGGGTMSRKQIRNCTNPKPVHGGKGCHGSEINIESKSCSSYPCPATNERNATIVSDEKKSRITTTSPMKKPVVTTPVTKYDEALEEKMNISGPNTTNIPTHLHGNYEVTPAAKESTTNEMQTEFDDENSNESSKTEDPNNILVLTTTAPSSDVSTEESIYPGLTTRRAKSKVELDKGSSETTTTLPKMTTDVSTPSTQNPTTGVVLEEVTSFVKHTSINTVMPTAVDMTTQSDSVTVKDESGKISIETTTISPEKKTGFVTTTMMSTPLATTTVTNLSDETTKNASNIPDKQGTSNNNTYNITGESNTDANNQTSKNVPVNQNLIFITSNEYSGQDYSSVFSSEGIALRHVNATAVINVHFKLPVNITSLEATLTNHEKVKVELYDKAGRNIKEKVLEKNNYAAVITKIKISIFVHDPEEDIIVSELLVVASVD